MAFAFCPYCGGRLEGGFRFCPYCGSPLNASPAPQPEPPRYEPPRYEPPRYEPPRYEPPRPDPAPINPDPVPVNSGDRAAEREKKKDIMQAILAEAGADTEARAKVFSLPITEFI